MTSTNHCHHLDGCNASSGPCRFFVKLSQMDNYKISSLSMANTQILSCMKNLEFIPACNRCRPLFHGAKRTIRKRRLGWARMAHTRWPTKFDKHPAPWGLWLASPYSHNFGNPAKEIYCPWQLPLWGSSSQPQTSLLILDDLRSGRAFLSTFITSIDKDHFAGAPHHHGSSHPRRGPTDAKGRLQLAGLCRSISSIMGLLHDRLRLCLHRHDIGVAFLRQGVQARSKSDATS